jgi:hypothetical protein
MTTHATTSKFTISTYYGNVPSTLNGHIVSEEAEKIRKQHYADKTNFRKHKLTIEERIDIKNAMKKSPKVPQFNQTIKIA